jgi:hypothetical protein
MVLHSPRRPTRSRPGPAAAIALVACVVHAAAGCSGGDGVSTASTSGPPISPGTAPAGSAPAPGIDGPPAALASVEGGDAVAAQLGTYTWAGRGSDAPWLQGAPLSVGRGEVLGVAFDPMIRVSSWTARFVPLGQDGPDGGQALGEGQGPIHLDVPPPGGWTILLQVEFPAGLGTANYAWAVTVG